MMMFVDVEVMLFDDVDVFVFDCDGMLIDIMGLFYVVDVWVCDEVGVKMLKGMFYEFVGVFIWDIFCKLCVE